MTTRSGQSKVFAVFVVDPWWACFNPQMTRWEDTQQVDWLLAALIPTDDWIKQLLRISWWFLGVKDAVLCCSPPLWQRVVYSTRISVQPDPAAAARLPLQSRLLGPGSVTVHLDWIRMEGREMTSRVNLCNVCWLSRYGASSWHGHRLLGPSLAVVSDERAGESHLRPLIWRVMRSLVQILYIELIFNQQHYSKLVWGLSAGCCQD